jgi:hypothetical protein
MNNKQQLIDIFIELLESLWKNLDNVIGSSATALIFQSALRETSPKYPFLEKTSAQENGVEFSISDEELSAIEWSTLRMGLVTLLDNSFGILTDLTGGILVDSLRQEVTAFDHRVDQLG